MEPLEVVYRTALDGELRAEMTAQLIKYLLFMRGQIPCLYDELQRVVEKVKCPQQTEGPRRKRLAMDGATKRAIKCVETAERLFGQLDAVFTLHVQRVALVFGSSLMSPREVVLVDFKSELSPLGDDSSQTDEEDMSLEDSQSMTPPSPSMPREKLLRLCSQKLIRALFARTMEEYSSSLSTTRLHVAVLAARQQTRVPGFVPKQQFKLRLPKDRQGIRTHYVEIHDGAADTKQTRQTPDTSVSDTMWYVLETPIAGFSGAISTI